MDANHDKGFLKQLLLKLEKGICKEKNEMKQTGKKQFVSILPIHFAYDALPESCTHFDNNSRESHFAG